MNWFLTCVLFQKMSLPLEIFELILDYLTVSEMLSLRQVNKDWSKKIIDSRRARTTLCLRVEFPIILRRLSRHKSLLFTLPTRKFICHGTFGLLSYTPMF